MIEDRVAKRNFGFPADRLDLISKPLFFGKVENMHRGGELNDD